MIDIRRIKSNIIKYKNTMCKSLIQQLIVNFHSILHLNLIRLLNFNIKFPKGIITNN